MSSKLALAAGVVLMAGTLWAGTVPLPRIDLPPDSPVVLLSSDYSGSNELARGGAMVLDLHAALSFRNATQMRIRGVTLIVLTQDVTPGGKASVTVPSLNVGPGEAFPVRIDLRLLRPIQTGNGASVRIGLDGVLFDNLGFYGPDRLNSRRALTVYEMEARRDRQYFKQILATGGLARLQLAVVASLARQASRPGLTVQMLRGGRATNVDPEKQVRFAFLQFPGSPIQPLDGTAEIAGNEAKSPKLEVLNRSRRPVKYLEIGWIVRDEQGREFLAGSVPAEVSMAPGQRAEVLKDTTLRFPGTGVPVNIAGMTGFVNAVEFGDGHVWIPERSAIADPQLQKVLAPSPEEERLLQIYVKKGRDALVAELNKY